MDHPLRCTTTPLPAFAQTRITPYIVRTEWIPVPKDMHVNTGILRVEATTKWDTANDSNMDAQYFYNVPLHPREVTVIRSRKDNSILGIHIPRHYFNKNGIDPAFIATLIELVEDLGPPKKKRDDTRGIEDSRNYSFHIGSKQDAAAKERGDKYTGLLSHSEDYKRDGDKGVRLKDHCLRLWAVMGKIHEKLCPEFRNQLQNYRMAESAQGEFLAVPWPAMAINRGREGSPVECKGHKDIKDEPFSMSALFAFGKFHGGDVLLAQVKARVEVKSGDGLLFPGRIMAHWNDEVDGIRHSLVAYAPQETMSHNQHEKSVKHREKRHKKLTKKRAEGKLTIETI